MRCEILEKSSNIICKVESVSYSSEEGVEKFKAKVILCDGSNLRISETWIDRRLFGYSYYWLDENNNQIIGWDNAPHHLELDNYPHHKHIKVKKKIVPSYEVRLEDILSFIKQYLEE